MVKMKVGLAYLVMLSDLWVRVYLTKMRLTLVVGMVRV
jgi:hypothetical protein